MKTAEELFKKYTYAQYASPKTDKIIFSKKDEPIYITTKEAISDLLTEHDAEIKALIEPIEGRVAKLLDDSSFTFGVEPRITLIKIDRALTELKKILASNEKK